MRDNAGWAVRYHFVPRDLLGLTNLRADGPGTNVVGIAPGAYGGASGTWHSPGLPLRIAFDTPQAGTGDLNFGEAKATLTVAAGTTIQLENGGGIFVAGGGLRLLGTARQPVTLTSARPSPAPGDWGRIEFHAGTTACWPTSICPMPARCAILPAAARLRRAPGSWPWVPIPPRRLHHRSQRR